MAHHEMAATLAEWRKIERQLQQVEDGTPEAEQLQAAAAELRNEVKRLTSQPGASSSTLTIASDRSLLDDSEVKPGRGRLVTVTR